MTGQTKVNKMIFGTTRNGNRSSVLPSPDNDDWNVFVGLVDGKGTLRRGENILTVNSRSLPFILHQTAGASGERTESFGSPEMMIYFSSDF